MSAVEGRSAEPRQGVRAAWCFWAMFVWMVFAGVAGTLLYLAGASKGDYARRAYYDGWEDGRAWVDRQPEPVASPVEASERAEALRAAMERLGDAD